MNLDRFYARSTKTNLHQSTQPRAETGVLDEQPQIEVRAFPGLKIQTWGTLHRASAETAKTWGAQLATNGGMHHNDALPIVAISPVPKCEGPVAPSSWLGQVTETVATRPDPLGYIQKDG